MSKLPDGTITATSTIKVFDHSGGRVFNAVVTCIKLIPNHYYYPADGSDPIPRGYDVTIEGATTGAPIKEADDD